MRTLSIVIFVALASLLLPRSGDGSERIVGGQDALGSGSTVALVEKEANSYWGYFCAGTLIRPRWVLTARHCVESYELGDMDVITGRRDLQSFRGQRIAPVGMYTSKARDVALLYLAQRSSQPTSPVAGVSLGPDQSATIRGWGAKRKNYPRIMQKARVDTLSPERCEEAYSWSFAREDMICAGGKDADACWGDSGGPLLWKERVVGVVSFGGLECAEEEFPTAYAKIPMRWLQSRLQNPPRRYANIPSGEDTRKEPRPFVALRYIISGDTEKNEYQMYLSAASNFQIKSARLRIRGSEDLLFCGEAFCAKNGQWFHLSLRSGLRHADVFFDRGNKECPTIDALVRIKHNYKPLRKATASLC